MTKLTRYEPYGDHDLIVTLTEDPEGDVYKVADVDKRIDELMTALHDGWSIIANAHDFARWHSEIHPVNEPRATEWKVAADRWRDEVFHPLTKTVEPGPKEDDPPTESTWEPPTETQHKNVLQQGADLLTERNDLLQCIGLFTTVKGDMVMNPDNPMAMAQEVVDYVEGLERKAGAVTELIEAARDVVFTLGTDHHEVVAQLSKELMDLDKVVTS